MYSDLLADDIIGKKEKEIIVDKTLFNGKGDVLKIEFNDDEKADTLL